MFFTQRRNYGLINFGRRKYGLIYRDSSINPAIYATQMYGQAASTFARMQPQKNIKQVQRYSPSPLGIMSGTMNMGLAGLSTYASLHELGVLGGAATGTGAALAFGIPAAAVLVGSAIFDLF